MRHFSNLTRVQNMGWELKYFAISRNKEKKVQKITQNITTVLLKKKIGKKWFNKGKVKIRDLESIHLYS